MKYDKVTIGGLVRGEHLHIGDGVWLQGMTDEHHQLVAMKLTHELEEGGVCTSWMQVNQKKKRWSYWEPGWKLEVHKDKTVSMTPSLACWKHYFHGFIFNGEFQTTWQRLLTAPDYKERLRLADELAREFGGSYRYALASIIKKERKRGRFEHRASSEEDERREVRSHGVRHYI